MPGKLITAAETVLNSGKDRELLKLLRDETTLIVLMLRVRNQERNEQAREKYKERELRGQFPEDLFQVKEDE